jgi:hypothetical protein
MNLRILLLILVPPVLLFLCALVVVTVPLPHPFPPPLSGGRNRMSAIVTGILGAGYIIGLTVYVIASFLRAGRILERILTSAGLVSESYLVFGRQYHGVIQRRQVGVTFVPSQGASSAQLNVYVSADLDTRIAVAKGKPLLDCNECPRVNLDESELGCFQVYSQKMEYARRLLADTEGKGALTRLLDDRDVIGSREVYLQPERVWLRARPQRITEGQFQQWLDDLMALAQAGESARPAEDISSSEPKEAKEPKDEQ